MTTKLSYGSEGLVNTVEHVFRAFHVITLVNTAINGLGRIGRAAFKILPEHPELDLVAVNELVPTDNLAYLLRYDTV